jgi:hypothetical protein
MRGEQWIENIARSLIYSVCKVSLGGRILGGTFRPAYLAKLFLPMDKVQLRRVEER